MSDVIHLLPDSVANQIAAGEVIQRPASVVKELMENAIDADAHNIDVVVVDAGRTSIQVVDDGCGMSETDARLAFERHTTSKITRAADLFTLRTMGFRGEALASIAAVAQVELKTRKKDLDVGTQISIAASKIRRQEPTACPVGSNFKVENLFFNVPARRKFLKSNATELGNILNAYERIVLVYPETGFRFFSNGAELTNLRPGSVRQRIVDIFGKRLDQNLLPIDVETSICKITGFVGKPESARKRGAQQFFFVNGRYMRHPFFHKAVTGAYDRMVASGMQVPYFIYFEVAPEDIDVNIHPTKTEIKFENEQAIWQILVAAVKDAIGRFCEIPSIDFDTEGKPDIPAYNPSVTVGAPEVRHNPLYNPFDNPRHGEDRRERDNASNWEKLYKELKNEPPIPGDKGLFDAVDKNSDGERIDATEERSPAHYQYKGRYIMTAVKSGLMIIDQHRADVRIRYEDYLKKGKTARMESQKMLFPEVVSFSPSQQVILGKLKEDMERMGFELTDMGQGNYSINAIPAGLNMGGYVELINGMVADAASVESGADSISRSLALSLARRSAITYGEVLSNREMEGIVNSLFCCSNVNYTPDGKAILCILPQRDIEQLLG